MKRYRILVGHVSEENYSDGSTALNNALISGLKEVADLSLVVTNYWEKRRFGPLVEETVTMDSLHSSSDRERGWPST